MTDQRLSTVEAPLPCPVLSPTGLACTKPIPAGWSVDEGHSGGHFWASERTKAILDGGHYDSIRAVSGQPFDGHLPDECVPPCPYDWAGRR